MSDTNAPRRRGRTGRDHRSIPDRERTKDRQRAARFEAMESRTLLSSFRGLAGPVEIADGGDRIDGPRRAPEPAPRAERVAINPEVQHLADPLRDLAAGQPQAPAEGPLQPVPIEELIFFDEQGRVGVSISTGTPEALLPRLEQLGFQVEGVYPTASVVEGFLPVDALGATSGLVQEGLMTAALPLYRPITSSGAVTSQADFVLEADRVRNTNPPGVDGAGTTVVAFSDSFDTNTNAATRFADDVASGDLPNNVLMIDDSLGGIDEGRAMLQLVHDLAPGADLAFSTVGTSKFDMAGKLAQIPQILGQNGLGEQPTIIHDDIVFLNEAYFQDDVISQSIDALIGNEDVTYFSSAGNLADQAYDSFDAFGNNPLNFTGVFNSFDFDPSGGVDTEQLITIPAGATATLGLQWDDPFGFGGVDTDLDLFLLNPANGNVLFQSATDNIAAGVPMELISVTNTGTTAIQFDIAIDLFAGPEPGRLKYVNFGANGGPDLIFNEFATNSATVVPHAASALNRGVAAAPFFNQQVPEDFTSKGPATILFDAAGNRLSSPVIRQSPQITATDGTDTTFFGNDFDGNGFGNFFGTSAAAPHAAAVASLILSNDPSLSPSDVYDRLESTAIDLEDGVAEDGFDDRTGFGLINAFDAIFGDVIPADVPFADDFESEALSINWETNTFGAGRLQVANTDLADEGNFGLGMDSSLALFDGHNEAILHLDAFGKSNVVLSFRQREFNDEGDPLPETFTGSVPGDGVALSTDGINWHRLIDLSGAESENGFQTFLVNLNEFADANGLTLGPNTQIKFQQTDNFPIDTDGFAFDSVQVQTLTEVAGVVVNPNESEIPGQRSQVVELAVDFTGGVDTSTIDASDFTLTRTNDGQTFGLTIASISPLPNGNVRVLFEFSGPGVQNGSLPDGDYELFLNGNQITDDDGEAVDGDGDMLAGGAGVIADFHRFFGDVNGDRMVGATDLNTFRNAFLNRIILAVFDFNADGFYGFTDITEFRRRFGKSIDDFFGD